jgi:hypothetical protein
VDNREQNYRARRRATEAADAFVDEAALKSDPNGSYTGYSRDCDDPPTQDADDL